MESYNNKINTNFDDIKAPKEGSLCSYLLIIVIDPVFKMAKKYHPQVFSEEYKDEIKEKKINTFSNDDIETFSENDHDVNDSE